MDRHNPRQRCEPADKFAEFVIRANDTDLDRQLRVEILGDLGLRLEPTGYRFLSYDPEAFLWEDLAADDLYKARELPEEVYMELFLEDKEVVLDTARTRETPGTSSDDREEDDRAGEPEPQLLILSSGELTPFQLWVSQRFEEDRYLIEGKASGEITLLLPETERR